MRFLVIFALLIATAWAKGGRGGGGASGGSRSSSRSSSSSSYGGSYRGSSGRWYGRNSSDDSQEFFGPGTGIEFQTPESKLIANLLRNYDYRVRPVQSHRSTVPVKFGFALSGIEATPGNIFLLQGWTHLAWQDSFLQWDPQDYDDIEQIKIHPVIHGQAPVLWMPDVTLYSGQVKPVDMFPLKAVITHQGNVSLVPHRIFRVQCPPLTPGSPDKVVCKLRFGSWVYSQAELDLQLDSYKNGTVDIDPIAKSEWSATDSKIERVAKAYECCPGDIYPYVEVSLTLTKSANAA